MGAPSDTDVDSLMAENEELKRGVAELTTQHDAMQKELDDIRAAQ